MKLTQNFTLFIFAISLVLNFENQLFGQQSTIKTLQHDGLSRTYRIYVPNTYTGQENVPLLFNLHGYTSNAQEQEFYGNFRPIADTANFILIHPEGTLDATNTMHWNSFGASNVDDVGFISTLIDTLAANYSIDLNRVFSVGMSNGGYMSYELACALGEKITAVGSVTGSMPINRPATCNPIKPTPIIQIHGTQDLTVPYNGNANSVSMSTLIDYWVEENNCNTAAIFTAIPNTNTTDQSTVEHYLYTDGDNASQVSFFKVINGGHTWPGSAFSIGVTNQDINASVEIWKFFQQYDTESLLSLNKEEKIATVEVYPNPTNGIIQIKSDALINEIIIYDITGKKVDQLTVHSNTASIPLKNKGVSFLHIQTEKGNTRKKVITY